MKKTYLIVFGLIFLVFSCFCPFIEASESNSGKKTSNSTIDFLSCQEKSSTLSLFGYCNQGSFYGPLSIGNFISARIEKNFVGFGQFSLYQNSIQEDFYGLFQIGGVQVSGSGKFDLIKITHYYSNRANQVEILKKDLDLHAFYGLLQFGVANFNGYFYAPLQLGGVNANYRIINIVQGGVVNANIRGYQLFEIGIANISGIEYNLLQLGIYTNFASRYRGLGQFSIFNAARNFQGGFQLGLLGYSDNFQGFLQAGLVMNRTDAFYGGAQLGIINKLQYGAGMQAGIYNQAQEFYGVQFGLVNYAKSIKGLQIGLINILVNGFLPFCPLLNLGF